MSDDSLDVPWDDDSPLLARDDDFDFELDGLLLRDVISEVGRLVRLRGTLSCPTDDIDNRVLTATRFAVDSLMTLLEQRGKLSETQKLSLVENSKFLIKEANDVIEKTLKIRPNRIA